MTRPSAREAILGQLRRQLPARDLAARRAALLAGLAADNGPASTAAAAAASPPQPVPPRPPMPPTPVDADPLAAFCARAIAQSSTLEMLPDLAAVPAAVARYLAAQQLPRTAVCWPAYAGLDWAAADLTVAARPAHGDDLTGITGVFCAIAETGTLMLHSGPATAATTSLLPETHIAIVPIDRLVADMEAGFALLRAERGLPPRAVNFISGPSRTGDIEQTIVLGAHGPYRVHLLLIAAPAL